MAEKPPRSAARVAAGQAYKFAKATAAFVADNVIYGKVAQQGAAEAANALFAGTAYVPYGSAQQPEDLEQNKGPTVHGAAVADAQPTAKAAADIPPLVNITPEPPPTDPLQRVAERNRASSTSRQLEIG